VQWNRAATILRNELEDCLMERGYVKFELTDEQYGMLKGLEPGSDARREYLHAWRAIRRCSRRRRSPRAEQAPRGFRIAYQA
jgi:hypothetical protein